MTERVKGFTVILKNDIREDDFEQIMQAVQMIKGVLHIEPNVTTSDDHINRERIKYELRDKFYDFIKENLF